MIFFIAGVLVSALCVAFPACNAPDGPEEETEIQPVPANEISGEVSDFFDDNNVYSIGLAIFNERNDWEKRKFVNACVMINSAEELPTVDADGAPVEVPAIDFDTYTLVIGQYASENQRWILSSQKLLVEQDTATMNLVMGMIKEDVPMDLFFIPMPKFIWGLYPKIAATSIGININVSSEITYSYEQIWHGSAR
jgi:hypothetical protein